MSDSYVQVPPNSSGAEVATRQIVVGSNTVQLQCVVLGDPTTADSYAAVTAKGTQGAFALAAQDMKDAGRTPITLYAVPVVGVITTEALFTMTQVKGGVVESSATNYTVTSGKTFRITSFTVYGTQTTTTLEWARANMRYTTSGTVTTTSGLILSGQISGIAATSGSAMMPIEIVIPDGYELPSGSSYGVGNLANATSTTIGFTITGFEY